MRRAGGRKSLCRVTARGDELLFPGLAEMLDRSAEGHCDDCAFRAVYGAEASGEFGGVKLCETCKLQWQEYLGSLAARTAEAFPFLQHSTKGN